MSSALTLKHLKLRTGGVSCKQLFAQLEKAGVRLNRLAVDALTNELFDTAEASSVVQVVFASLEDLGLSKGGHLSAAIDAAASRGYKLCPPDLGPHLRLAYLGQQEVPGPPEPAKHQAPPGSVTVVDQRPPEDGTDYRGFYIRRIEGAPWLRGYTSWSDHVWQPKDMLAFLAPENAA